MASLINRDLFAAVYHATCEITRSQSTLIPTQLMMSDQPLLRVVDMQYCPGLKTMKTARLTIQDADGAKTIFNETHDDKRWSGTGHGLALAKDQGALYCSLSSGALCAEMAHYNQWLPKNGSGARELPKAFSPRATVHQKALFRLRPVQGLLVVDFSKYNTHQQAFFDRLDRDPNVAQELKKANLTSTSIACRQGEDYSCSRGVALGLAAATSPAYDGILVQTARDNPAIRDDGDNIALFGPNRMPHRKLKVECAVAPVALDQQRIELRHIGY